MAKQLPHVTLKELGAAINNAVLLSQGTEYFVTLGKDNPTRLLKRQQRLRAMTEAHFQIITELLAESLLKPEEAAQILLAEALLVAGLHFRGVKLPMFGDLGKRLLEDGVEVGE